MMLPVRELPPSSARFHLTFQKLFSAGFRRRTHILMALVSLVFLFPSLNITAAWSDTDRPVALRDVAFDQKVNAQLPLNLVFLNEAGKSVRLGEYFSEKPVILALIYYDCQDLCPLVLENLARTLRAISFDAGKQFEVLVVSFDPRDLPSVAAAKKAEFVQRYRRSEAVQGLHFLTGEEASIRSLTGAVGFRYSYDATTGQYGHAAGIVVLTPQGKISRYFYGIEYSPRDLRLSLVEASENKIGTPVDQLLLFCYHYDPTTGKYSVVIMNVLRLAGLATVLILGAFVLVMLRRERSSRVKTEQSSNELRPYG
jgi:protein SCO1